MESTIPEERAARLLYDYAKQVGRYELNGIENVGGRSPGGYSGSLALFRLDCSADSVERGIAGRGGSSSFDTDTKRKGRK